MSHASLPTVDLAGRRVSRLICGGNPLSGFSHFSEAMDWDMVEYYTAPRILSLLDQCLEHGIDTFQSRGDRHQMRIFLEHRLAGGRMQWIAQTASEFADIRGNIDEIARYKPIAIYHHGTHVDNCWHTGKIDAVADIVKMIKDRGLAAGVGSHIPEVIEYAEEKGWETDFYMCCLYNLARQYKSAPAVDRDAYARDKFPAGDPDRMMSTIRGVGKPCIAFKVMAASRHCATPESTRAALERAFAGIKPTDLVDVGMFQKYSNQVAENSGIVRRILGAR